MTEAEALALLNTALGLVAQLGTLAPQLVSNWQAIKAGLATGDEATLNAQIVETHAQVQSLDAQLQALRGSLA